MKIFIDHGEHHAMVACEGDRGIQLQISGDAPVLDAVFARNVGMALLSMADVADACTSQARAEDAWMARCTWQRRLEDALKGRG